MRKWNIHDSCNIALIQRGSRKNNQEGTMPPNPVYSIRKSDPLQPTTTHTLTPQTNEQVATQDP